MKERDRRYSTTRKHRGQETVAGLARRPFVQLALLVAALAQVVPALTLDRSEGHDLVAADVSAAQVAALGPIVPAVAVSDTPYAQPTEATIEGEVERLGERYRQMGYPVTPALADQIGDAAAEYSIEPEIAFGLVRVESSFRNTATSSVGAVGLTQLMPRTASWVEPGITRNALRDPRTNLRVGFKYLRYLLDKYEGDENLALLAYNRGPGTVDRALKRGRNPDNGYADFVRGVENHGHKLFTR